MTPIALATLLLACNPWKNPPDNGTARLDAPLWDPASVVSIEDGLYFHLPNNGGLVRVQTDGSFQAVDLDGAELVRMTPTADGSRLVVWDRFRTCKDPEAEKVSDCSSDDLGWSYELSIVRDGAVELVTQIPAHLNRMAFSPDGRIAVAYLDYESGEDIPVEGVVDLTQVAFIDLDDGEVRSVSAGFSANNVIFSLDAARAVVLSRSRVVVVDLSTFEKTVEFPLTLDADQQVDPSSAALTPDGRYALITTTGSADLYKLDLDLKAIDIVSLDAVPSRLMVSPALDRTILAYGAAPRVDLMDHDLFNLESQVLDHGTTEIVEGDTFALLYDGSTSNRTNLDLYRMDYATKEITEFVLGNPVQSLQLTESRGHAVALLRPRSSSGGGLDGYQASRYGLGVVDLVNDEELSLVLESAPVGLALVEEAGAARALLLLEGKSELLEVDLSNPAQPQTIELDVSPNGIGSLPDGRFFITHDAALGMVSFLDPTDDSLGVAHGFAALGLATSDELPRRGGQE